MTPALWLCCFGVACWIAAYLFSFRPALEGLCIPLGIAGMAPLALACWAYVSSRSRNRTSFNPRSISFAKWH